MTLRIAFAALLLLMMLTRAVPADCWVTGKVLSLNPQGVYLSTPTGPAFVFLVPDQTQVEVAGAPVNPSQLQPGQEVRVWLAEMSLMIPGLRPGPAFGSKPHR